VTKNKIFFFILNGFKNQYLFFLLGPPGTGKTVVGVQIMKVLLAKENQKTNIGPILTICFTNHALDQFLEVNFNFFFFFFFFYSSFLSILFYFLLLK
jgi:superfamily II DNA or RNA helicase